MKLPKKETQQRKILKTKKVTRCDVIKKTKKIGLIKRLICFLFNLYPETIYDRHCSIVTLNDLRYVPIYPNTGVIDQSGGSWLVKDVDDKSNLVKLISLDSNFTIPIYSITIKSNTYAKKS